MIRWVWSMVVQPVPTLRLAVAGGVPAAELVTATIIAASLYSATVLTVKEHNPLIGLYAAMTAVVLHMFGVWLQVLLIWLSARLLGWQEGTMGQVFATYGPVFALNVALAILRWGPDVAGYDHAALALDLAGSLWQWGLMVLGIRFLTGLSAGRALLAILPAVLLWDVPWFMLSVRLLGQAPG